jgi:predicted Zn-dependent protease
MRRAALAAAIALAACAWPGSKADEGPDGLMSIERERELTARVAAQIRAQAPFVTDPIVLGYVNDIGQQLVRAAEPQPFVYRFSIIEDDTLNAFTIGGGYVYLNSGVIESAGDVSELGGVLAHEIAHVRMRHMARRAEGQGLATLVTLAGLAAVVLAGGDPEMLIASQSLNVALQLKNSRAAESEADREGMDYMLRAGYDPEGMARFFERISAANPVPGEIPAYLYSHPAADDRARTTRVMIEREGVPPDAIRQDARLHEIQARLATLGARVVGGSGTRARAHFDRGVTDPLLDRARRADEDGAPEEAERVLLMAADQEPGDPRVWLALADLAEARGDDEQTGVYLERAIALDPDVPLVQYRLGVVHKRLGNRTRAVFYLEQAAQNFKPGSKRRRKAELEIEQIVAPALAESGLSRGIPEREAAVYERGEPVLWWGKLNDGLVAHNPPVELRWLDPAGDVAHQQEVRMDPFGSVEAEFDTGGAALGTWTVEARLGDSRIDEQRFEVVAPE